LNDLGMKTISKYWPLAKEAER